LCKHQYLANLIGSFIQWTAAPCYLLQFSGSERESSDPESDDISRSIHPRVTYTSHQSTPTSLTITSNRTAKRVLSNGGSAKKRKRSREDGKKSIKRVCEFESRPFQQEVPENVSNIWILLGLFA